MSDYVSSQIDIWKRMNIIVMEGRFEISVKHGM